MVAVGQVSGRQSNPAVWITKDGRRFRRVEDPDLIVGANGGLFGVDADKEGRLYAIGAAEIDGANRPVLFRSGPGGQTWQATVLPDDVFVAPEGQQSVNDIAIFQREDRHRRPVPRPGRLLERGARRVRLAALSACPV